MRIQASRISAGYGRNIVIRDVDLCLGAAEFVGLIGPNGSGKSTLLRALSRAIPILAGELNIGGRPASGLSVREVAREIAFVPQMEPALFDFPVRDIVLMGRNPHLARRSGEAPEDYSEASRAMAATDTLQLADRLITELSGGEQRRVLIARALAQRAPALLMDEPTAHLDLSHQCDILSVVRRQVDREGVACLAALHDLNLAAAFCDRLVLLSAGSIAAEGPVDKVLRAEVLAGAFGPGISVGRSPGAAAPVILPRIPLEEDQPADADRIHVVCGGGTGAEILSMLRRRGHLVTAGVLNRSDSDQLACDALGIEHVSEAPFSAISATARARCEELMRQSSLLIITQVPFGKGNLANLELARAAQEQGKPVYVIDADRVASRDFTGGEAERLYRRLIDQGAVQVQDTRDLANRLDSAR